MSTHKHTSWRLVLKHVETEHRTLGNMSREVPLAPRWQGGTCPWYPGRWKAHRCRCPGSLLWPPPPGYFHLASGSNRGTTRQEEGIWYTCTQGPCNVKVWSDHFELHKETKKIHLNQMNIKWMLTGCRIARIWGIYSCVIFFAMHTKLEKSFLLSFYHHW